MKYVYLAKTLLVHCFSIPAFFYTHYVSTLIILSSLSQGYSQSFPSGFGQVNVASGLSNPTVMAFAPDGRIFVAEQNGRVRVIKNGVLLATPFVQINVNATGERGLIGIALDPNFTTNKYIYLYYTLPTAAYNRVSRFTANGDVVVAGSEKIILNLDPLSTAVNHNGGAMHFGKDGKLYVAVGENAQAENAQNLDTYHGKLLRINPDGSAPADNPFPSGSAQRRRIWAYGLRNPFTFSVNPRTGKIFVNDVGQVAWEEINDATEKGKNFAWPRKEGKTADPAYVNPVYSYQRLIQTGDGIGCAITGGVFFDPATTSYPAQYKGKYFFQDYCNGWINFLDLSSGVSKMPFAKNLANGSLSISSGNDGNLYYLNRVNGAIYKIVYNAPNTPPFIADHPDAIVVSEGQAASFSVSASGSNPLAYQWQKNGVNISGATTATYSIPKTILADGGQYRVAVKNAAGAVVSNAATLTVQTNTLPVASIVAPLSGTLYTAGQSISFEGAATDKEDGVLPASAFRWEVVFHHDTHSHDGPPIATGVKTGSFQIPNSGETSANVWYRLYLIVTDSKGATHKVYRDIYPRKAVLSFATEPAGLTTTLDGQTLRSPSSVTSVQGLVRSLGTASTQTHNSSTFVFDSWAHGGNLTQTIVTPGSNTTYKAHFARMADNPGNTVNGINYAYYEGKWSALPDFSTLTPVKTGILDTFSLTPKNTTQYFAFRYTSYIHVPTDGVYTFYTASDDGSQLYIGNTLVVNNDGTHSKRERSGSIRLKAGKHAFTVTFFEELGMEELQVFYAGPGITKRSIPASALFRENIVTSISAATKKIKNYTTVFPNPASNQVHVQVKAIQKKEVSITIADMLSRIVYTNTQTVHAGENEIIIPTARLENGTYLLHITMDGEKITQRIILLK